MEPIYIGIPRVLPVVHCNARPCYVPLSIKRTYATFTTRADVGGRGRVVYGPGRVEDSGFRCPIRCRPARSRARRSLLVARGRTLRVARGAAQLGAWLLGQDVPAGAAA